MITAGMRTTVATYCVLIFWATIAHGRVFPYSSASADACGNIHLTCISFDFGHRDNSSIAPTQPRRWMPITDHPDSLRPAWEPSEVPQDLFDPCDLPASTSAMTHRHSPSHPPPPYVWPSYAAVREQHPDICPSAAAPRHPSTSTSSGLRRDRARLRQSTSVAVSVMSAARLHQHHHHHHHHHPASEDFGDFVLDAGSPRTPLGVLYHSCSLWELASLVSAVAWLLVCLAA
ncbi:hypothetical protein K466DRAFT_135074 [Polyporus arcularius HHB13444]|uniref:Uncharacterized protein n=1 Tax=Polyporus arcularius HHB13444 TaxID=1314778 RepID=A0A5C3PF49_9APHY|nr:hypothetical protein K466DRAFT_135074 [Polyporus arcularius HHB13444]